MTSIFSAMRSPIPIEPMHSFSHGHHRQRHMAHGRERTATTTRNDMAHTGQSMQCSLQFAAYNMHAI